MNEQRTERRSLQGTGDAHECEETSVESDALVHTSRHRVLQPIPTNPSSPRLLLVIAPLNPDVLLHYAEILLSASRVRRTDSGVRVTNLVHHSLYITSPFLDTAVCPLHPTSRDARSASGFDAPVLSMGAGAGVGNCL